MNTIRTNKQHDADNLKAVKKTCYKITDVYGAQGIVTVQATFNDISGSRKNKTE